MAAWLDSLNARWLALSGAFVCAGLIAYAIYLQYWGGLEPCPLCMLQRIVYIKLGIILLIAAIHGPGKIGMRIYAALAFIAAAIGTAFAARHVWLQWYPPDFNACTADLFYQLRKFPLYNVIERAMQATGDCAKVDWTLLGLSIAEWSFVWFVLLGALTVAIFVRAGNTGTHIKR